MAEPTLRDVLSIVLGCGLGMLAMLGMALWVIVGEREAQAQHRPLADRWEVAIGLADIYVLVSVLSAWAISGAAGTGVTTLAVLFIPPAGLLTGVLMIRGPFLGFPRSIPTVWWGCLLIIGSITTAILVGQRLIPLVMMQP